jgi:GNAT superfamily N-acetyltransferase
VIGLLPTLTGHYLLGRDIFSRGPEAHRPGLTTAWVTEPQTPDFSHLLSIAAQQGLDRDWCEERLAAGDGAIVAFRDGQPAGMGLVTCNPFWVEEISRTFNPGPDGCYLYATFVSPAHRGQRIQKLLDSKRLAWAAARGRRYAYALVERDNHASLRGHQASGFKTVARIDLARWRSLNICCIRRTSPSGPCGAFIPPQRFGWRIGPDEGPRPAPNLPPALPTPAPGRV